MAVYVPYGALCRQYGFFTVAVLQGFAGNDFTVAVDISGVKIIYAAVYGFADQPYGIVFIGRQAHTAKAKARNPQSGIFKCRVFHTVKIGPQKA
jgi:hypothetical protein